MLLFIKVVALGGSGSSLTPLTNKKATVSTQSGHCRLFDHPIKEAMNKARKTSEMNARKITPILRIAGGKRSVSGTLIRKIMIARERISNKK